MYTLCKHAARTVRKVCIIKEFTLGTPVGEKTVVLDEKNEKGGRASQDTSVLDITSDGDCNPSLPKEFHPPRRHVYYCKLESSNPLQY